MNSLLVLQDSPGFGGHEIMFLRLLPALIEAGTFDRIVLRYPAGNEAFAERLRAFAGDRFEAKGWPYAKQRAEPFLAPLRRRYIAAVRALIAAERPAAMLLLQGRIENCAVPTIAAPRDLRIVSYVPMAHRMAELGRRGFPGDLVRRRLYRRPDQFIVPSHAVAAQLVRAGARAPIAVADNVVEPPPKPPRDAVRRTLGIAPDAKVALVLGRLDIAQKGLDTLAAAIRRQADALAGWTILIVGSGEGEQLVADLADEVAGRVDVKRVGWTDRPHDHLAAADVLLMPSRWEGLPLTMLEAMAYGVPVVGSAIDVFEEYLPRGQRIDFATADLAATMQAAVSAPGAPPRAPADLDQARACFVAAFGPPPSSHAPSSQGGEARAATGSRLRRHSHAQ